MLGAEGPGLSRDAMSVSNDKSENSDRAGRGFTERCRRGRNSSRGAYDRRSVRHLLQQRGRAIDVCRERVHRVGDDRHERSRLVPLILLDTFTNSRQRLDAVAGVETWRVHEMFEPFALRQAGLVAERPLGPIERLVQGGEIAFGRVAMSCRCDRDVPELFRTSRPPSASFAIAARSGARSSLPLTPGIFAISSTYCRSAVAVPLNSNGNTSASASLQERGAGDARERRAMGEIAIRKMREPVVRVVDGVIDAAAAVAAEAQIKRRDLKKIKERGVIGAGAERVDRQIADWL